MASVTGPGMPAARILLVALYHETHCFVPDVTGLAAFDIRRGPALLARAGDGSPTDGFLEVAARHAWEVVPGVSYAATPYGADARTLHERRADAALPASAAADLAAGRPCRRCGPPS